MGIFDTSASQGPPASGGGIFADSNELPPLPPVAPTPAAPAQTSKFQNLLAQGGDLLTGKWDNPGHANAIEQVGGNENEALALQKRARGLGVGLAAQGIFDAAMTPLIPTGIGLPAIVASHAALGAVGQGIFGAVSEAEGGATPEEVGKATLREAGMGLMFGAAMPFVGKAIGYGVKALRGAERSVTTRLAELATEQDLARSADVVRAHGSRAALDEIGAVGADFGKGAGQLRAAAEEAKAYLNQTLKAAREVTEQDILDNPDVRRAVAQAAGLDEAMPADKMVSAARQRKALLKYQNPFLNKTETDFQRLAREKFHGALPTHPLDLHTPEQIRDAARVARKAVWAEKKSRLAQLLHKGEAIEDAAKMVPLNPNASVSMSLRSWASTAKNKLLLDVGDLLRSSKAFGRGGKMFADTLDVFASTSERLTGSWNTTLSERVLSQGGKALTKAERIEAGKVLAGELSADSVAPHVKAATEEFRKIWNHIGDEAESVGLSMEDRKLSSLFKQSGATPKSVREALSAMRDGLPVVGNVHFKDLIREMVAEDARMVGNVVTVPFKRNQFAMPMRYDPKYIKKLFDETSDEFGVFADKYLANNPGSTRREASKFLKEHFRPGDDNPFELRGGSLQWSRQELLDEAARIYDVKDVLPHYVDASARRVAAARVFGSKDEVFSTIRKMVEAETGGGEPLTMLDKIWHSSQGRGEGYSTLESAVKTAASTMFLSPKTWAYQMAQLANPAAEFGMMTTMKAAFKASTSKTLRRLSDVVGAVTLDLRNEIAGESIGKWAERLNPSIPFIRKADAFTRSISSIASALHAEDLAATVAKGGPKGAAAAERLHNVFGLNAEEIIAQGGKMTDEQLRQAAREGSNLTMFAGRVQNLPYSRLSQTGRTVGILQNYASQQAGFFNRRILAPMRQGNFAPFVRSLAAMGIVAPPIVAIEQILKNKDGEGEAMLTNMWTGGMMGSFGKFLSITQHPEYGVTMSGLGAGAGAVEKVAQAGLYAGQGKFDTAMKYGTPEYVKQLFNLIPGLDE